MNYLPHLVSFNKNFTKYRIKMYVETLYVKIGYLEIRHFYLAPFTIQTHNAYD